MKRKLVLPVLLVLFSTLVFRLSVFADDSCVDAEIALSPPTTVACGDSISDAVNGAPPGSTITVTGPCNYSEYIVVFQPNQTITTSGGMVTAEGIDFTPNGSHSTLNGSWTFTNTSNDASIGWGIHIEANNTTIDGS